MSAPELKGVEQQKVLARVRKMLALANDAAASEGERDNAMRMAHATLAKYNLTLSAAEAAGATPEEARIEASLNTKGNYPWKRTVFFGIAELYFCTYFSSIFNQWDKHYFVGRESNTITAREIGAFVISSIQREASKQQRELCEDGSWHRSFCKGAAHRVYYRCKELREQAERASQVDAVATGTSLVLRSVYETEAAANAVLTAKHNLKAGASRERSSESGAYGAGRAFGNNVALNRQIGGGAARKQLK